MVREACETSGGPKEPKSREGPGFGICEEAAGGQRRASHVLNLDKGFEWMGTSPDETELVGSEPE